MARSCCPPVVLFRLALLAAVFFTPTAVALPEATADADATSPAAASGPLVGVASPAAESAANEILARLENEGSGLPEDELEFYKRLYDFGVGKRAYSYVSEYKRLPVYNFGLGKRGGKQYGFGLGKRASGRQFSFGLGKRTPSEEDYYYPDEEEEEVAEDDGLDETDSGIDKRDRLYSFGLGKRTRPFGFGLGKRGRQQYSFGLGKRGQQMYGFGLGKRGEGRMYSFGLGKRPNFDRVAGNRFNFGLGKRSDQESTDDILGELSEEKRVPEHRFAFGLGKREVSPNELEAVREEQVQDHHDEKDHHEPNDAASNGKHAVKRSLHYGFGIGKRTNDAYDLDLEPEDEEREAVSEDFTRFIRRPYSFGLGKRVPLYDFGIGKRAE